MLYEVITVQALFDAMASGNARAGDAVLAEQATFVGTRTTPEGVRLSVSGRDAFLEGMVV